MKTFTIRNIDISKIKSLCDLKSLIKDNFKEDIRPVFDVGYIQGSSVIRIRSKEDLAEMWSEVRKSKNTNLWCDGLIEDSKKNSRKRKLVLSDDEESDEGGKPRKKQKDTDEKVFDELQRKHGQKYTPLQLRIWAELIAGRVYNDMDEEEFDV